MKLENKNITAVVSDFDGTLLPADTQELNPRFFPVIEKLLDAGVYFIATSGRQYPNMKRLLAPIADRIGIVAENGGLIAWKGEPLHTCTIPYALAMELIKDMQEEDGGDILVGCPETCYTIPREDEWFLHMLKNKMCNVVTVPESYEAIRDDMLKIALMYRNGIPEEAKKRFQEKYAACLTVVDAGNGWLDFIPKESGKGSAVTYLSKHLGFSLEETASFGDSENDISMLEITGISFAIAHAKPAVRAVCDHICTNVEDVLERGLADEI